MSTGVARPKRSGLLPLLNQIATEAKLPSVSHVQVLLEYLGDPSDQMPVIVYVRYADRLLADIEPALLGVIASWEAYAWHGNEGALDVLIRPASLTDTTPTCAFQSR